MLRALFQTVPRLLHERFQIIEVELERFAADDRLLDVSFFRHLPPDFEVQLQILLPWRYQVCLCGRELRSGIQRVHL